MKFLSLQLLAYGHFDNRVLDFDPGIPFHVIYGDNEAGKSTSLRAVCGLLFGIPVRTTDDFLFVKSQLRIGGTLQNGDDKPLSFVRLKKNKDALRTPEGEILNDAVLSALTGGLSQEAFESRFCFSHSALRAGSKELANSQGELGSSLFQAGGNLTSLRALLEELSDEEGRLWKPRGEGSGLIAKSVKEFRSARQDIKEHSLSPVERLQQEKGLKEKQAAFAEVKQRKEEIARDINRLTRVAAALPVMTKLRLCRADIVEMGDVVKLPSDATQQRINLENSLARSKKELRETSEEIGKDEAILKSIVVPENLLTQKETISVLHQGLKSFHDASKRLPDAQARLDYKHEEFLSVRSSLLTQDDEMDMEALRLLVKKLGKLRLLISQRQRIEEKIDLLGKEFAKQSKKLQAKSEILGQSGSVLHTRDLKREIKRAAKAGTLEEGLAKTRSDFTALSTRIEIDLKSLGLWERPLAELEAAPVPGKATIDHFQEEFGRLLADARQNEAEIEAAEQERKGLEKSIEDLLRPGALLTEEELGDVRKKRDDHWRRIRSLWLRMGDAEALDEQESLALGDRYEALVSESDQAGDKLRFESERVTMLAIRRESARENAEKKRQLSEKREKLIERETTTQKNWEEAWQPCGLTPRRPQEMAEWLTKRQALCAAAASIRETESAIGENEKQISALRTGLVEALTPLGHAALAEGESLAAVVERLDEWQQEQEAALRAREILEKEIRDLSLDVVDKQKELNEVEQEEVAAWEESWRAAAENLKNLGSGAPDEVVARLEDLDRLIKLHDEWKALEAESDGYRRTIDSFKEEADAVVQVCARDLSEWAPDLAIVEITSRLEKARSDSETVKTTRENLNSLNTKFMELRHQVQEADSGLDHLVSLANCQSREALAEAEECSARLLDLENKQQSYHETIMTHAAGASLEVFLTELGAVDVDAVAAHLAGLRSDLANEVDDEERSIRDIAVLEEQLSNDGGSEALEAAQKSEEALKRIQQDVERYARVKLARYLLGQEIDRYRQSNQNPILRRASELFRKLTRNSFQAISIDEDGEKQFLVGVRADNVELRTDAMSDGTRDQLFLALRMASLENDMSSSRTMPLLVDDILVNFDDKRAEAAFEVLGEISEKTQVLFFTHHSRLLEVGQKALGARLQTHCL